MLEFRNPTIAGLRRQVSVAFLPEQAAWTQDIKPLAVHQLEGIEVLTEGKIVFDTKIAHFDLPNGDDLVIEVVVSGERRYRDKAKYKGAAAIGVQHCMNGFMIAEVLTGDSL